MTKVLIVEDDNFLLNAYRVKLTKVGFEVVTATDGEKAIESLKTFKPDIIILDLLMPLKDGFVTLGEIRANKEFQNTPILVASNLGQKEDIDHGMALGATGYIIKSDLSLDELVEKIKTLTSGK